VTKEKIKGKPVAWLIRMLNNPVETAVVCLLIFIVLFVILSPVFAPAKPYGYCGNGPTSHWDIKPTEEQGNYIVLTKENTGGALLSNNIRKVFMTPSGILVGYAGELADNVSFITQEKIETCKLYGTSAITGHVNAFYHSEKNGDIWVGTDRPGIYRYSQGVWEKYTTVNGLTDNVIYDLVLHNSILYAGTMSGVSQYNQTNNTWQPASELINSELPMNIHTLLFASNGDVWLGTVNGGLLRKTGDLWTTYRVDDVAGWENLVTVPELKSNNIRVLQEAADGKVWVGADPGLAVYDSATNTWTDKEPCCESGTFQTLDLKFDSMGQAWVTGSAETRILSATGEKFFWAGGQSLAFGILDGEFDQSTIVIGTAGQGLFIGSTGNESPK
jgi:ligand-binding sensor domain-containing protein